MLGLSLSLTRPSGVSAVFGVTLTGLTDGEARIGSHASIGYTTDPVSATETVKWSASSDPAAAATFGTGSSPTDYTSADGFLLYLHVTDGGETVTRSAPARYAPGTLSIADQSAWTVDAAISTLDASASGANLTFTYAASGLPAGLSINSSTGAITGTPTSASSGTATVTATDQYGRALQDTFTWSALLRTQATGGADLDLSFPEDSAITSTDLLQNWTDNGNTLTFVSVSPALPAGLSISSAGLMTGTPTTITADATYTLTMEDGYGRETSDTFTLQITEANDVTAPTGTLTMGTQASDGSVTLGVGSLSEDSTLGVVWTSTDQSSATRAQVKTAAEGGAGLTDQLSAETQAVTVGGGPWTLTDGLPSGQSGTVYWQLVLWDAAGNVGDVQAGSLTLDTTAPTLSSLTGTQTGESTATTAVTSNEAGGTIYFGVRPSAATALTDDQLIAGAGGAGVAWDSDTSPTADANNAGSFTGLTHSTDYQVDAVHVDAFGNRSDVVSSDTFTTAAPPTSIAFTEMPLPINAANASDVTFSSVDIGTAASDRTIYVFAVVVQYDQPTNVKIGGVSASKLAEVSIPGNPVHLSLWSLDVASGETADIEVIGNLRFNVAISAYAAYGKTAGTPVTATSNTSSTDLSLDTVTSESDDVIAAALVQNGTSWSWSGLTEDAERDAQTDEFFAVASVTGATAGTTTITATNGLFNKCGIAVALS